MVNVSQRNRGGDMKPGRYERRTTETATQVIRTAPDGSVDVLSERLMECCVNCVHAVIWKNACQEFSCELSGDSVPEDWHCNAYEEVAR